MQLVLKRLTFTDKSTIGGLFVDGVFQCYVLEDPVRPAGQKVYGKTAIPAGTYPVVINLSPRFQRLMPLLVGVPGFEGVRIHTGNKPEDTEGCLLVGTYERSTPNWVGSSKVAYDALYPKLKAALDKQEKVTITIS